MNVRPVTTLQRLQGGVGEVVAESAPPQAAAQDIHDGVTPVEDVQRFVTMAYTPIAPHARKAAMRVPRSDWEPVAMGDFDGLEWLFIAARGNGTNAVVPVGMAMDSFVGLCLDFNHAMGRNEAFGGPILALWTHNAWLGGEIGYNDARTGLGSRWNTTANFGAQDTVTAGGRLGPMPATYEAARLRPKVVFSPQESAVRDHLGLAPEAEVVRVTTTRSRQWGWASVVGLNIMALLRLLCRIDYTSSRDITYSTWLDATTARHVVMDGCSVLSQWWRMTWRAWRDQTHLEVPDIAHPQCLAPGDVLSHKLATRHGQLKAWGLWWLYGGLHDAQAGEAILTLSRPAVPQAMATEKASLRDGYTQGAEPVPGVTICLTSKEQVSRRHFVSVPGGAGYDSGGHLPTETQWRLTLPLTPANLASYRECVTALEAASTTAQRRQAMSRLAVATSTNLGEVRSCGTVRSTELGVRVGLFPSNLWADWMPSGFSWGLGNHTSGSAVRRTWTQPQGDGHQAFVQDIFVEQAQDLRGPDGDRVVNAIGIVERFKATDGTVGGHLLCASRILLSRADAAELARYTVAPLASAYVALPAPQVRASDAAAEAALRGAGWRVSRDVSFEQRITPAQLRALLQTPPAATDGASVALRQLLRQVPPVAGLDDAQLLEHFATHFSGYLKDTGIFGLGALYRALDDTAAAPPDLIVRNACDAYDRPQALADLLTQRYHDVKPDNLAAMRAAVAKAQREMGSIADLICADRFLDAEQKDQRLAALGAQRGRLDALYLQDPQPPLPVGAGAWLLAGQNLIRHLGRPAEGADSARQSLSHLISEGYTRGLATVSPCNALLSRLEGLLGAMS